MRYLFVTLEKKLDNPRSLNLGAICLVRLLITYNGTKKDITQFTQCFFYCLSFRWYLWVLLTQPPPRKEKYIKRSDLWNRFFSFFILMFLMSPQRWNILSNSWLIIFLYKLKSIKLILHLGTLYQKNSDKVEHGNGIDH